MKSTARGVCLLAFLALFWGCSSPKPPPPSQPCSLDELRPGDMISVTFSDLPAQVTIPEQKVRVKEDGTLSLPMNVSVVAATKKIGVVEREIHDAYVPKYYRQLSVAVKTDDRWYSVGGEVKMPDRKLYIGPTTVLRAIQSCGDFTDFAQRKKVRIQRANGRVEIVNCNHARDDSRFDVSICPGDAIFVPRRLW